VSLGLHRIWKDLFVMSLAPTADMRILDVAGGTGDVAFRIVESKRKDSGSSAKQVEPVVVVDINEDMLRVGKERAKERGYRESEIMFVHGNAEKLPAASETVDAYVISFGMRNVTEPELALQEVIFRLQSAYFNSCGIIGISSIASWRKVPHVRICTSTK